MNGSFMYRWVWRAISKVIKCKKNVEHSGFAIGSLGGIQELRNAVGGRGVRLPEKSVKVYTIQCY